MWLLKKRYPNQPRVTDKALTKAFDIEVGTDPRTHKIYRKVMIRQGIIKPDGKSHIILSNYELTGGGFDTDDDELIHSIPPRARVEDDIDEAPVTDETPQPKEESPFYDEAGYDKDGYDRKGVYITDKREQI